MKYTLPGLVDLQVNGFAGIDYNSGAMSADQLEHSLQAMRRTGVTRCLPTIITSSSEHFANCARPLVATDHPLIAGLHMEGPYISPVDGPRGAHPLEHVALASITDFQRRQEAAQGRIVMVTLAPEMPGAIALIEYLVKNRVVVAIGHSAADASIIEQAVAAGASLSTHLGNACSSQIDRHHNSLWPQLAEDRLSAGLIADGHHLSIPVLRTMIKAKSPARSLLVTDAVAAAGAPPGIYQLAGQKVELDESARVTRVGTDHLVGSGLTLDRAVANTCRWTGLPLATVWAMASTQPARAADIELGEEIAVTWEAADFQLTIDPAAA